jgi:hypothetical protein
MPAERINAMSPASPLRVAERRPPALRRSWLFCPGADREALLAARGYGADVLIQELEDFTPPERRPEARGMTVEIYAAWRAAGILAAVRINPLESEGRADLSGRGLRGRPRSRPGARAAWRSPDRGSGLFQRQAPPGPHRCAWVQGT